MLFTNLNCFRRMKEHVQFKKSLTESGNLYIFVVFLFLDFQRYISEISVRTITMSGIEELKCSLTEKFLQDFWPEWHVIRHICAGEFCDIYEIRREYCGIESVSSLKVVPFDINGVPFEFDPGHGSIDLTGENTVSFMHRPDESGFSYQSSPSLQNISLPSWFSDEIRVMRMLKGVPNIVSVEDFHIHTYRLTSGSLRKAEERRRGYSPYDFSPYEDDVFVFIRMEQVTGLQEMTGKLPLSSMSADQVRKLGIDLCRALTYCEKNQISCPDIRPENLFVDRFGNYKIGVFNISRHLETGRLPLSRAGMGMVSYLPPEASSGDLFNRTADTYSLGLILYVILNEGRIPFLPPPPLSYSSSHIDKANMRRLHGEPLPAPAHTDPALWRIIKKACEPLPENRFQSAADFSDALSAYTEAEQEFDPDEEVSAFGDDDSAFHFSFEPAFGNLQGVTDPFSRPVTGPETGPLPRPVPEPEAGSLPGREPASGAASTPDHGSRKEAGSCPHPASTAQQEEASARHRKENGTEKRKAQNEPVRKGQAQNRPERRKGSKLHLPAAVALVLAAAAVAVFVFKGFRAPVRMNASPAVACMFTGIPGQTASGAAGLAGRGRETINNTPIEISDPVLRNSVFSALGISGDRLRLCDVRDVAELELEITEADKGKTIAKLSGMENFHSLQKLSMRDCGLGSRAGFSLLQSLPSLRILDLHDNQISDPAALRNLTGLTWLNLSKNKLRSLSSLKKLTRLQTLALYKNEISDLSGLERMTGLKELYLDDNKITDLSPLKEMRALETLRADNNQIADLTPLEELTELKELVLSGNKIADAAALRSLRGLSELWIDYNQIKDADFLTGLTRLTYLNLEGNKVEDISSLKKHTGLTDLVLAKNKITDLTPLEDLTKLVYLDLGDNKAADLSPLKNLKGLESLYVNSNTISDPAPLKELKKLKTLDLGNNAVQDVSALSALSSLESLDLYSNSITDLTPLKGLTNLTWLNIGRNKVSDISAVAKMTKLETLQIYRNSVGSLSSVEGIKSLKYLVADNNSVQDIQPLRSLGELRCLYLEYNNIKDLTPLTELRKLEKLYIAGNSVTDYTPLDSLPEGTEVFRESQN